MTTNKKIQKGLMGDEAPRVKDVVVVLAVMALLTGLSWVIYHVFNLTH